MKPQGKLLGEKPLKQDAIFSKNGRGKQIRVRKGTPILVYAKEIQDFEGSYTHYTAVMKKQPDMWFPYSTKKDKSTRKTVKSDDQGFELFKKMRQKAKSSKSRGRNSFAHFYQQSKSELDRENKAKSFDKAEDKAWFKKDDKEILDALENEKAALDDTKNLSFQMSASDAKERIRKKFAANRREAKRRGFI